MYVESPQPASTEEVVKETPANETLPDENALVEPLTREERESMNDLSTQAYGKRLAWQKMLRKGELRPATAHTAAGDSIQVRRLHHFTVNEIKLTMQKLLKEREEAAAKAEAERVEKEKQLQAKELEAKNETPAQ